MKKTFSLWFLALLLLSSGCAARYLTPISKCQPLSAYNTFIITPFDGGAAHIEELKYAHLPPYIAGGATARLKEQLEFYYLFPKVNQSSECVDRALRIEGKILKLEHYRRSFHVEVRGRIVDCQNNKPLYIFEFEEEDSESAKLPIKIGDDLLESIKDRLTCQ